MPFNTGKGDLNLMAFVNHLKFIKWNGDLVLEYMAEYTDQKIKNYHFLKEYLNG
jgi:sugar phosphate isomerase/epimerase